MDYIFNFLLIYSLGFLLGFLVSLKFCQIKFNQEVLFILTKVKEKVQKEKNDKMS